MIWQRYTRQSLISSAWAGDPRVWACVTPSWPGAAGLGTCPLTQHGSLTPGTSLRASWITKVNGVSLTLRPGKRSAPLGFQSKASFHVQSSPPQDLLRHVGRSASHERGVGADPRRLERLPAQRRVSFPFMRSFWPSFLLLRSEGGRAEPGFVNIPQFLPIQITPLDREISQPRSAPIRRGRRVGAGGDDARKWGRRGGQLPRREWTWQLA